MDTQYSLEISTLLWILACSQRLQLYWAYIYIYIYMYIRNNRVSKSIDFRLLTGFPPKTKYFAETKFCRTDIEKRNGEVKIYYAEISPK